MEHGQQYPSETVKIKSHVCEKEITRKNYKHHNRNVHQKKDPEDLTPFGQSNLTSFFTQSMVVKGKVREAADD